MFHHLGEVLGHILLDFHLRVDSVNTRSNYELQSQDTQTHHLAPFNVFNSLSTLKTSFKERLLRLLRQFDPLPAPPPLISKIFSLLEKVMYWCTYHRPLGTSVGRNQTGGRSLLTLCHRLHERPEGSGPARRGDIPPGR